MSRLARPALTLALAASLIAGFALVVPSAAAQERFSVRKSSDREFDRRVRRADPGKVVATELAFARAAQEKGQWSAFAEFAADDAVMFVPEPVNAREWLRKQQNPAQAVRWQPHQVWSSCDGTLAVTKGAWQRPDGSTGYFTTVWERQRNGEYKWVMDQGDVLPQALDAPDMIVSKVADCGHRGSRAAAAAAYEAALKQDEFFQLADGATSLVSASEDGTLAWSYDFAPAGQRRVRVAVLRSNEFEQVLDAAVQN